MGRRDYHLHELGLPADVVEIARNQRALLSENRERIVECIRLYEEQLSLLKTRIANLQLPKELYIRQELRQDEAEVQRRAQACKGLLLVIRSIPIETMGEIFLRYLALAEPYNVQTSSVKFHDEPNPNPGLLCLVCRYWRTVAVSTPALWANITIRAQQQIPGHLPRVKNSHVRGVMSWMDRVTSYPWSLNVESFGQMLGRDDGGAVLLSQLLHRPASLYLSRLMLIADLLAIGLGEITFPRVTTAFICCDTGVQNPSPMSPDFPSLPSLMQAILHTIPSTGIPSQIPWPQLTHLFLGGKVPLRQWRAIFKLCVSLQRGCFELANYISSLEFGDYPEIPHAILPHLTELAFLNSSPLEEPLHGISMPSLVKLQLFTSWDEPTWDNSYPELFSSLTHLTLIGNHQATSRQLIAIFKTMPLLTELFFHMFDGIKDTFEFLTFGQGKFNLRLLRAVGMYMETVRWQLLEDDDRPRNTIPSHSLADFITSRTHSIQQGQFASIPHKIVGLESLVLRVGICDPSRSSAVMSELRETVAPLRSYGCRIFLSSDLEVQERQEDFPPGGTTPDPLGHRFKHWDDGFMDFLDCCDQYSLYPSEGL